MPGSIPQSVARADAVIRIGRKRTLACALVAWSVLTDCASTMPAAAERSSEPGPSSGAEAPAQPAAQPVAAEPCANVRQSARTFIGFASDQTLDDFEETAEQATELLSALKGQLCRLGLEQDRGGALRAAMAGSGAEITSVSFKSAELLRADVGVRTRAAAAAPADRGQPWIVRVERTGHAWRVLDAAVKK